MNEIDPSLIGRVVKVIFEDSGDPSNKRTKAWKGVLQTVGEDFIELKNDGQPSSYVAIRCIVAMSVHQPSG